MGSVLFELVSTECLSTVNQSLPAGKQGSARITEVSITEGDAADGKQHHQRDTATGQACFNLPKQPTHELLHSRMFNGSTAAGQARLLSPLC
jgi:hypothetical protein